MKLFKVKLNSNSKAKADQIVDGYLGNSFGHGEIQSYSRGEAIKKARMFNGNIEQSGERKFFKYKIGTSYDGFESEYNCIVQIDGNKDPKDLIQELTRTFFDDDAEEIEDNVYESSESQVSIFRGHMEITEAEFNIIYAFQSDWN